MSRDSVPTIVLTESDAVVWRTGRSSPTLARVLGREHSNGVETVWLDRLVHHASESSFEGWDVSGAISTVLSRPISSAIN